MPEHLPEQSSNPLLQAAELPPFSAIEPAYAEPAIRHLIARNKAKIDELLDTIGVPDWDNLIAPIETLEDELAQAWSPVSHLNSVCNSDELREAYNQCLPLLSEYGTWMGQHEGLYRAYRSIADSDAYAALSSDKQTTINNALRDFRLAGVSLPQAQKARYGALRKQLSELSSTFGENVLDATNAWSRHTTREALDGLPDSALASAAQAAQQAGLEGYLITLDHPSYLPVMTYCKDRELREEVYTANCTRASELGPNAGEWDNTEVIEQTLKLRQELAVVLGFANYAELSLATKMAQSPEAVLDFLTGLSDQSREQGLQEWQELASFARSHGTEELQAWDVAYFSELLRQERFAISQEMIRPFLPVERVLAGLFEVTHRLYGLQVREVDSFDSYHEDARLFEITDDDTVIARFYLDLYARAKKRGGAWMGDCRVRRMTRQGLQLPVAYLVCNFTPPVGDQPALLTHSELTTLFHEFGHGLHHMLTRQTVAAVSGINGVAWDAVELPSQFLENWCWEPSALAFISGHFETGEPLPQALLEKMLAARNFQAAMIMLRQLEFALFDFRLHLQSNAQNNTVQALLDEVRDTVAVSKPPPFNRFQNSFSHIFAGGYAAGYYSYKWAEVLSADAFSRFEEEGIFNPDTGNAFRRDILERGGSDDPMALFTAFRGREPSTEPLLRHSGIQTR